MCVPQWLIFVIVLPLAIGTYVNYAVKWWDWRRDLPDDDPYKKITIRFSILFLPGVSDMLYLAARDREERVNNLETRRALVAGWIWIGTTLVGVAAVIVSVMTIRCT